MEINKRDVNEPLYDNNSFSSYFSSTGTFKFLAIREMKVKLRFSAPSAGIGEIAKR